MATIQLKRRTSSGTGPLTGTGTIKAGEPLVDFNGGHLYIAKADKTGTSSAPISESDYLKIPNTTNVDSQITSKISALGLGTAAYKNTGTSSGNVPVLDNNGKLVDSVIPKVAITNTFVVASEVAMLALSTAQEGDVAVRTDVNKSFILKTNGYSVLANWQELLTPADKVQSVNGKTGTVTITLTELGGVGITTFNNHVASNMHLTEPQREKLANVTVSKIYSRSAAEFTTNVNTFDSEVIDNALVLCENVKTAYNPTINAYSVGIKKGAVLTPSSVIDGGTY